MRQRRRAAVALGLCGSFFLATVFNVLLVPGSERRRRPEDPPEEEPEPRELARQLRERHREVLRYRAPAGRRQVKALERRLMDLEQRAEPGQGLALEPPGLGCADLGGAPGAQYLGSGYTKAVHRLALNRSLSVALKSVDLGGHDMESCVREYGAARDCYRLASYKILKEMMLLQRLRHPNVLQLYGYCYKDSNDIPDTLTAITELGAPLEMIQLLQTSWEDRFRICLSLVRLLHYLAHSPLGSVTLLDFRPRQFVIVDGELKVTDLDDASIEETACSRNSDCFMEFPARNFTLPCSVEGICQNMNEKRNLYNAYRFFFTYLLPHSAPSFLKPLLDAVVNATGELRWGIDETIGQLEKVLYLYKSGLYLGNTTRTPKAEYRRLPEASISDEDYKCWPSYHHKGCLLSVFDVAEAIDVCENHSQCTAFVWTNQTTWTGRHLVFFKLGSSHLVKDPAKMTYVKVTG
ncbi:hypothetical protein NDU88_010006 [Pleurodeles waltl]|uniref:Extracellular tyrosine-protein kinase PKDCC n=1 Tax=Pleurodeles waltl TaxID=8319 RepID=A0AAV7RXR2_PLEWA|nr:hypothetical protein NDU88_010006 [Pleurodeles waltl]